VKNTHEPPALGEKRVAVEQTRVFLRLEAGPPDWELSSGWQKFKGAILSPCEGAHTRVQCVRVRALFLAFIRNGPHSPFSLARLYLLQSLPYCVCASGQFGSSGAPRRTTVRALEKKAGKSPEASGA
jgi:hypothetical protein